MIESKLNFCLFRPLKYTIRNIIPAPEHASGRTSSVYVKPRPPSPHPIPWFVGSQTLKPGDFGPSLRIKVDSRRTSLCRQREHARQHPATENLRPVSILRQEYAILDSALLLKNQ